MNSYDVTIVSQKKLTQYKIIIISMMVITILSVTTAVLSIVASSKSIDKCISVSKELDQLTDDYKNLAYQYDTLYDSYNGMYDEYISNIEYAEKCQDNIAKLNEVVEELNSQNISLVQSNDDYFNLIQQYEQRSELFDKYEYAIVRTNGTRTDITYDQLINLEQLTDEKNIDVDLVLSIAMVESSGTENACNATSTARGYGQIISGTGKFVYEKIMKEGKYNHDYALNGDTNFKMMVNYLRYLEDENNGNMYATIRNYRGEGGDILDGYIKKINNYLEYSGKSVASIK